MACCFCLMSPKSPFCRIVIAVRGRQVCAAKGPAP